MYVIMQAKLNKNPNLNIHIKFHITIEHNFQHNRLDFVSNAQKCSRIIASLYIARSTYPLNGIFTCFNHVSLLFKRSQKELHTFYKFVLFTYRKSGNVRGYIIFVGTLVPRKLNT